MPTPTLTAVANIFEDIKTSWYFRVWAIVWLVCSSVLFFAFLEYSSLSEESAREDNVQWYSITEPDIRFPDFAFKIPPNSANTLVKVECLHGAAPLYLSDCTKKNGFGDLGRDKCRVVLGSGAIAASNLAQDVTGKEILVYCNVTTNPIDETQQNALVGLAVSTNAGLDNQYYDETWINPSADIWVLLEKLMYKKTEIWNRDVIYHSNVPVQGRYEVNMYINNFRVYHIEPHRRYTGWMAIADIGGFAYFMVIIHTLVLFSVGFVFSNDSLFLGGRNQQAY